MLAVWLASFQAGSGVPGPPTLDTVITAFAGIAATGLILTAVSSRDKTRAIWQALNGPDGAAEPSGLLHDIKQMRARIEEVADEFDDHVTKETIWHTDLLRRQTTATDWAQKTLTTIDSRLEQVEAKLERRSRPR